MLDLGERATLVATATRLCAIIADIAIVLATWTKTWSIWNSFKSMDASVRKASMPLSVLIFRDGTLYFVMLLSLNTAMLVFDRTNVQFNIVSYLNDTFVNISNWGVIL